MENITPAVTALLLSGLFFPRFAAVTGIGMIVGRELYTRGYISKGPSGRSLGAAVFDVGIVLCAGATLYGGAQLAGLGAAIKALIGI